MCSVGISKIEKILVQHLIKIQTWHVEASPSACLFRDSVARYFSVGNLDRSAMILDQG